MTPRQPGWTPSPLPGKPNPPGLPPLLVCAWNHAEGRSLCALRPPFYSTYFFLLPQVDFFGSGFFVVVFDPHLPAIMLTSRLVESGRNA